MSFCCQWRSQWTGSSESRRCWTRYADFLPRLLLLLLHHLLPLCSEDCASPRMAGIAVALRGKGTLRKELKEASKTLIVVAETSLWSWSWTRARAEEAAREELRTGPHRHRLAAAARRLALFVGLPARCSAPPRRNLRHGSSSAQRRRKWGRRCWT